MSAKKTSDSEFTLEDAERFLTNEGIEYLKRNNLIDEFNDLRLPRGSKEADQCRAIADIFRDYVMREDPLRPLSIAVFGAPGSGKSFTVKQLAKHTGGIEKPQEINLSQLRDPRELGHAMLNIFSLAVKDITRMVFLDEFDSALGERSLGWLKWFLAPMQDGIFYYDGKPIAVGKAVFIFAGGTAERYVDFEVHPNDVEARRRFSERKGPDFISRLRGYINVEGINKFGKEQILRRAIVLHHQLSKRSKLLKGVNGTLNVDPELLKCLLKGTHYRHGARSMEALLDMCTLTGVTPPFRATHLPSAELRKLHVSRGPMDGIAVGVSAGQDAKSSEFSEELSRQFLEQGATLVHGGELTKGRPLAAMLEQLEELPDELIDRADKRIRNLIPHPSQFRTDVVEAKEAYGKFVQFIEEDGDGETTLLLEELECLKLDKQKWFSANESSREHLAWAVSLFRMRLRLAQEIDYLVVIGGKETDSWGRFPGIVEEVMLTLAFQRPIYVLGMAGRAAKRLGHMMGLSAIQHSVEDFLEDPTDEYGMYFSTILQEWSECFEVPARPGLPQTYKSLREFLRNHAMGSSKWPDNGLTLRENRELFDARDNPQGRKFCVNLIIQGITRRMSGQSIDIFKGAIA